LDYNEQPVLLQLLNTTCVLPCMWSGYIQLRFSWKHCAYWNGSRSPFIFV